MKTIIHGKTHSGKPFQFYGEINSAACKQSTERAFGEDGVVVERRWISETREIQIRPLVNTEFAPPGTEVTISKITKALLKKLKIKGRVAPPSIIGTWKSNGWDEHGNILLIRTTK